MSRHHRPTPGAATSTLPIRLELEALADDLHDQVLAKAAEYAALEAELTAVRIEWRRLDLEHHAAEQALRDLPDLMPTPTPTETPAAAQAA